MVYIVTFITAGPRHSKIVEGKLVGLPAFLNSVSSVSSTIPESVHVN